MIKDHAARGEFILMGYVAVVLTTRFHFLQPLLEDLHVFWHNTKGLVKHLGSYGAVWKGDNLEVHFLGSAMSKQMRRNSY